MNTNDGLKAFFNEEDIAKCLEDSKVEGKTLGAYLIGEIVGSGGMGTVHAAYDQKRGRNVVVKMVKFLSEDLQHREMMIARFRREAQAACRVIHSHVAVTFDFEEIDGRHLLVMERIEGRTLRDEITPAIGKTRALPSRKSVEIVIGILRGLEAIHAANILHRDLKPGNVMLTAKDDQVKILDFGLGKPADPSDNPALDMTLTQHGIPVGSPMYMSPEQIRSLPVDVRTDIYSVGVILFQLLTGKVPFLGKNQMETYDLHRSAPLPMIVAPGVGPVLPALQAVVRKAMAKEPGGRYGSASEMRAALEAIDFVPKPLPKLIKKRRSPVLPFAAFGMLVAVAAGLVLMAFMTTPKSGSETVPKTAKAEIVAPSKAAETKTAPEGMTIPPPPPAAATVAQGCEQYSRGQTTDAIATLTLALASKPKDAEGLFCLCGAYVRQPESVAEARQACEAYRRRPGRDAGKTKQVDLWLRRIKR